MNTRQLEELAALPELPENTRQSINDILNRARGIAGFTAGAVRSVNYVYAATGKSYDLYYAGTGYHRPVANRRDLNYTRAGQNMNRAATGLRVFAVGVDSYNTGSAIIQGDWNTATQSGASIGLAFTLAGASSQTLAIAGSGGLAIPVLLGTGVIMHQRSSVESALNEFEGSIQRSIHSDRLIRASRGRQLLEERTALYEKHCK